jgi:hypothetical protein
MIRRIMLTMDYKRHIQCTHILEGDRTKKYHPEMPDWRVLGCTCRGGHMFHFGGSKNISQNGTCDHLDMCILKLSSLAFQDDIFLFYLLLVYVNNCRTNFYAAPFVFFSYFTNFMVTKLVK